MLFSRVFVVTSPNTGLWRPGVKSPLSENEMQNSRENQESLCYTLHKACCVGYAYFILLEESATITTMKVS